MLISCGNILADTARNNVFKVFKQLIAQSTYTKLNTTQWLHEKTKNAQTHKYMHKTGDFSHSRGFTGVRNLETSLKC